MVIRGKASKCGNLSPPSLARPSFLPLARRTLCLPYRHATVAPSRCDFPPPSPKPNHYCPPPAGLSQHDASRAIQPVFLPTVFPTTRGTSAPLVASRSLLRSVSGPPHPPPKGDAHAYAACVRACLPARLCVRARSCNNNKKRATL